MFLGSYLYEGGSRCKAGDEGLEMVVFKIGTNDCIYSQDERPGSCMK